MDNRTKLFVGKLTNRNTKYNTKSVMLKTGEVYTGHRNKLTFVCTNNHEWLGIPVNIIRGAGCPICDQNNRSINQLNTHETFLQQLQIRNINNPTSLVYVSSGQQYLGIRIKIQFECVHKHTWTAKPNNILTNNSGCPICGKIRMAINNTHSHDEFLDQLNSRNTKYSTKVVHLVDGQNYSGTNIKLNFMCNHYHTWKATPNSILQGFGCPSCGTFEGARKCTLTQEMFINRLNERNLKYTNKLAHLCDDQEYISGKTKLKFTCTQGHMWTSLPDNILRGSGCPICSAKTFSQMAINWLQNIETQEGIKIQTALSENKEYRIPNTKFKVDGFCHETNTVYEFYGDYWHGNPKIYNPNDTNKVNYKSFDELYNNTIKREHKIKQMGYNIVTMWESDYTSALN